MQRIMRLMLYLIKYTTVKAASIRPLSQRAPGAISGFAFVGSGCSYRDTARSYQMSALNNQDKRLSFATEASEPSGSYQATDDDVSKWEKMYYSSQSQSQTQYSFQASDDGEDEVRTAEPTVSDIRVITFDLDNTLWKTGPTISHANKVLNDHMQSFGVASQHLVEVEMGRLFEADKRKYAGGNFIEDYDDGTDKKKDEELASEVMNVGETKEDDVIGGKVADDLIHIRAESKKKKMQPVYLTMLRKDAIRSLLKGTATVDSTLLEEEVEKAFQMWMSARTESITQNYAENVLATLSKIRSSIKPASGVGKLYIGAITDGNSDPMSVPSIGEYFDFVIRAEEVGVSKPNERVYKAAVAELMVTLKRDGNNVESFFLGENTDDTLGYGSAAYIKPFAKNWKDVEDETVDVFSEAVGPWWVHIGDDFFKDVVASKGFRMRSIWVRELIPKKAKSDRGGADAQSNEKRTVKDLEDELAKQNGVLKMTIGESEFLASALHEEFSDAILQRFDEVGNLLIGWHDEGLRKQTVSASKKMNPLNSELLLVKPPAAVRNTQEAPATFEKLESSTIERADVAEKKFCVFCGQQLPAVAKFCSGCGEKQP